MAPSTPPYIVSPPLHNDTTSSQLRISVAWKATYINRAPRIAAKMITRAVSKMRSGLMPRAGARRLASRMPTKKLIASIKPYEWRVNGPRCRTSGCMASSSWIVGGLASGTAAAQRRRSMRGPAGAGADDGSGPDSGAHLVRRAGTRGVV
jgi:hypothetical protein